MKTCEEWSLEFDLLYNNIASDKAPGLVEYEKSVFLTAAQEAVVVGLYKGSFGDSFESTEEVTAYLDTLVKQADCTEATDETLYKLSGKSYIYNTPSDLLFRTWESCKVTTSCGESDVPVIPVTQDEYWRTIRNPFKKQNTRKVLRLSYSTNENEEASVYDKKGYTELVSDYPITKYTVRYVAKPTPIILEDLADDGQSIEGYTDAMTCKLPEVLHQTILAEAVRMAKASWNA